MLPGWGGKVLAGWAQGGEWHRAWTLEKCDAPNHKKSKKKTQFRFNAFWGLRALQKFQKKHTFRNFGRKSQ